MILFPGPTEIDRAPSNKTVFEYDDVVLHCNATGNPLPNITWTKYGTTAVLDQGNAFTIVNISRHQSGRYQCIASNGVNQTSSAPFVINVLCKLILFTLPMQRGYLLEFSNYCFYI